MKRSPTLVFCYEPDVSRMSDYKIKQYKEYKFKEKLAKEEEYEDY